MSIPETTARNHDVRSLLIAGEPLKQHHGPSSKMPQAWVSARQERQIEHLHRLGPRVFAELLAEIAAATGQPAIVADRIEAFAKLDPEVLRFLGGDRFTPNLVEVVR